MKLTHMAFREMACRALIMLNYLEGWGTLYKTPRNKFSLGSPIEELPCTTNLCIVVRMVYVIIYYRECTLLAEIGYGPVDALTIYQPSQKNH